MAFGGKFLQGLFSLAVLTGAARVDAQDDKGIKAPQTAYDDYIGNLENLGNKWIDENPGAQLEKLVVLNTHRLDMMVGTGMDEKKALAVLLAEKNVFSDDEGLQDLAQLVAVKGVTPMGQKVVANSAWLTAFDKVGILIPMLEHSLFLGDSPEEMYKQKVKMPGGSVAASVDLADLHELSHVKNVELNHGHPEGGQKKYSRVPSTEEARKLVHEHHGELIADSEAAVETACADPSDSLAPLDQVGGWRTERSLADPFHFSARALQLLKGAINYIGKDEFCAMSADTRAVFYDETARQGGLRNIKAMQHYFDYRDQDGRSDAEYRKNRKRIEKLAQKDPDAKSALDFIKALRAAEAEVNEYRAAHSIYLRPDVAELEKKIGLQGMVADMQARARDAETGRVTKQSVMTAYAEIQDELRGKIRSEPQEPLHYERAAALKTYFRTQMPKFDYTKPVAPKVPAP
jgi:hypothetical protein